MVAETKQQMNILFLLHCLEYWDTGEGGGGGGGTPGGTSDGDGNKTGQESGGGDPSTKKDGEGGGKKFEWTAEQQAEINRITGGVREDTRKTVTEAVKAELAAERERERTEADRQAAEKQGEFEKLYNTEKASAQQLRDEIKDKWKPFEEKATRYGDRINALIEGETKDWPKEVKNLDPGKDELDKRIEWVERSRDLAAKLTSLDAAPNLQGGTRGTAKPSEAAKSYVSSTYGRPDDK